MDFDRNLPAAAADDDLGAPERDSGSPPEPPPKTATAQAEAPPAAEAEAPPADDPGPRKRKRRFNSPRASNAHLQRIEDYRALVEKRGWIFAPPSPPLPLSALLTHLTGKQIESLAG